jgi:hypothetical protein
MVEKFFFFGIELSDRLKSYKVTTYKKFYGYIFEDLHKNDMSDLMIYLAKLKTLPEKLREYDKFQFPNKAQIQELRMVIDCVSVVVKTENKGHFCIVTDNFNIHHEHIFATEQKNFKMHVSHVLIGLGSFLQLRANPEYILFDVHDMEVSESKQRMQKKVKVRVYSVRTVTKLSDMQVASNRIFNYIGFFFKFRLNILNKIINNAIYGEKPILPAETVYNQIYNNANLELSFSNCDLRIEFSKQLSLKIVVSAVIKSSFPELMPEFTAIEFFGTNVFLLENDKELKLIDIDRFQILKRFVLLSPDGTKMFKKPFDTADMPYISNFYVRNKFCVNQVDITLPHFFKPVIDAIKDITQFSLAMTKKLSENMRRVFVHEFIIDNRAENIITAKSLILRLKHQPVNVSQLAMPPQPHRVHIRPQEWLPT